MTKGYDPIKLASQLEQFETVIEQFAPVVESYYRALLHSGLPDELARKLVADWHTIWWTMAIGRGLSGVDDS